MVSGADDTLKGLRQQYDTIINSKLEEMTRTLSALDSKVEKMNELLISHNLPEMKDDLKSAKETLLMYNLPEIAKTVKSHDKLITRFMGIYGFILAVIYPIIFLVVQHFWKN